MCHSGLLFLVTSSMMMYETMIEIGVSWLGAETDKSLGVEGREEGVAFEQEVRGQEVRCMSIEMQILLLLFVVKDCF